MRAKEFISGTKLHIPTKKITNESIIDFLTQSAKYMPSKQRLKIVESMAENKGKLLNEILNNDMADDIINLISSLTVKKAEIGEKYIPVSLDIFNDTIVVYDVIRNSPPKNNAEFGILVDARKSYFSMQIDDDVYNYPVMERANYLMMVSGLFDTVEKYNKFRMIMKLKYDVELMPFNSSESVRTGLLETLKSLRLPDMEIRIDMDHLINRMAQRNLFDRYKEIDFLLRNLPVNKIQQIEPGQQFWIWDTGRKIGLGFRKLNTVPVLMLKTAISTPPKGDRNPIIQMDSSHVNESSGYIPSEKEKNDPRFKTALTKDVRPDAIKKNAKAFGFKVNRAGIPKQANSNGKISEAIIKYTDKKTFTNINEEIEYVCNNVKNSTEKLYILESIASRTLVESFSETSKQVINKFLPLSVKTPKIGNMYIPIEINVIGNHVEFYDVKKNFPARESATFGKLVSITEDGFRLKIDDTIYQYPNTKSLANTMMLTLLLDSVEKYNELRMLATLIYDVELPNVSND